MGRLPNNLKRELVKNHPEEREQEQDPKSYRPIRLLPVIGKLFEKLLRQCLNNVLMAPGALSGR